MLWLGRSRKNQSMRRAKSNHRSHASFCPWHTHHLPALPTSGLVKLPPKVTDWLHLTNPVFLSAFVFVLAAALDTVACSLEFLSFHFHDTSSRVCSSFCSTSCCSWILSGPKPGTPEPVPSYSSLLHVLFNSNYTLFLSLKSSSHTDLSPSIFQTP